MARRAPARAVAALGLLLVLAWLAAIGAPGGGRGAPGGGGAPPAGVAFVRPAAGGARLYAGGAPDGLATSGAGTVVVSATVSPPLASGTLGHRLRVYFSRPSTIVLLVVLVLCSLVLVLLRHRATRAGERRRNRTAGEP